MTRKIVSTAVLFLTLIAAAVAQSKGKVDRITLRNGKVAEGTIVKETYVKIEIQMGGTAPTGYAPADVAQVGLIAKIEYADMPAALANALKEIESAEWQEALAKINSAEDSVVTLKREKKPVPRAFWFEPWINFYRGVCLKELARPDDAVKSFKKLIEKQKDARLVPAAYEQILECYRLKDDAEGATAFIAEIEKAPAELKVQLKKRAQKQQAEIHLQKNEADKALPLFQELARDTDPQLRADGIVGVIRCKTLSKNPDDLIRYCEQVLSTSSDPALLLVASNALGDSHFERKQFTEAKNHYVNSVVRFHPGRGSPLTSEHERALWQLAQCYQQLASAAQDKSAKDAYERMAGRTYRELSLEYRSGRYADEAASRATE
ncbi:MAG: hypothetical protein HYY16_12555 [Planctomycetes bacterium]|nr:hypothetical protein [Planctomycetota bacterium]